MGAGPLKKGAMTPLLRKKGVPAKKIIPKCMTEFSSGIGLVNTKKYQPNTDQKHQIGIQLYILPSSYRQTSLVPMQTLIHKKHKILTSGSCAFVCLLSGTAQGNKITWPVGKNIKTYLFISEYSIY
jgi:hypothetical protein